MTSPNTSLVPDTNSKPSSVLENIPQEIKDQIYEYVIGGNYCVLGLGFKQGYEYAYDALRHAIFRVSKRVSYEAMEVFFSTSEFYWRVNFWEKRSFNQAPTNRIMNILLDVEMGEHSLRCSWWKGTDRRAGSSDGYSDDSDIRFDMLKDFGGTEILRKTIRIKFQGCSCYTHRILPTTYFQALATLTGFQTVIVEISMGSHFYHDTLFEYTRKLSDRENLRTAMRDVLEPVLGPAKIVSVKWDDAKHYLWELDGFLFLEFHPRQYLTKLQKKSTQQGW